MFALMAGDLLAKVGVALSEKSLHSDDDLAKAQRRRASSFLRRMGRIWPQLFSTLEEQNAALSGAADAARLALHEHGLGLEDHPASEPEVTAASEDDPLAVHAALLAELDGMVLALHAARSTEWASDARRRLRRHLAAAAAIESALFEGTSPS